MYVPFSFLSRGPHDLYPKHSENQVFFTGVDRESHSLWRKKKMNIRTDRIHEEEQTKEKLKQARQLDIDEDIATL